VYAWSDVLRLCDATRIDSIEAFDDRFPMTQSLYNWSQDLLDWLGLDSGKALNPKAFPIDVVNARLLAI
jgi:hypothetical protein